VAKRVQPRSIASLATLSEALGTLAAPGCTAPVRIDVALRKKGTKPGKRKLVLAARGAGVGSDRDVVVLRCLPGR
jgi:hypothetical protein